MLGGTSQFALENPLKPYQHFAIDWLMQMLYVRDQMGAGLFLDPGLGKTRITLTVIDNLLRLFEIRRALIIAPLRPCQVVWPLEIRKWGFNFSFISLRNQVEQAMQEDCKVEILNPDSLHKICEIKDRWDLIAVDESTNFKTWKTRRIKMLRKMLPTIPKRVILTGTPAANSLADLHSQMFIVDNGEALGPNVTYFRSCFMTKGGYMNRQWDVSTGAGERILKAIDGKVLRMKAEDHLDMPKLVRNDIWCDWDEECVREYKKLKRELYLELENGDPLNVTSAAGAYTKCRQYCNGTIYNAVDTGRVNKKGKAIMNRTSHQMHDFKLQALEDLSEELGGKPLLIAYQYDHDYTRAIERRHFKNAPVIKGGSKQKDVEDILKRWNAGKIRHLFCQCQAVSHGVNMQEACNDVAWYGLCDSPEVYEQFFRRVYRLGVKGDQVRIHRLLMRGTVELEMLERLNGKFKTQEEFLAALKKHAKGD
jgi:SNF2 family DNA or RNA helicase